MLSGGRAIGGLEPGGLEVRSQEVGSHLPSTRTRDANPNPNYQSKHQLIQLRDS